MVNRLYPAEPLKPVVSFSPAVGFKQIATSAREVTHLKLISTGGSAHVSIYDNRNGQANPNDLVWVMDSSLQTNDIDDFTNALRFKNGIYAVCDDGSGFNPQLCLAFTP